MNNDRFKFRAPYFKNNEFDGFVYFEAGYNCKKPSDHGYMGRREQCTGLKDKNGKPIFEGDIIELTRSRNYGFVRRGAKLEVTWNTFNCCGFGFGSFGNLTEKCASNCIVVGNIHENPELLK